MENNKLGITQGHWWKNETHTNFVKGFEICWSEAAECVTDHVYKEADADLIVDAGNTAQECGLLPSELLEQRDKLIAEVKELRKEFRRVAPAELFSNLHTYKTSGKLIKSIESE